MSITKKRARDLVVGDAWYDEEAGDMVVLDDEHEPIHHQGSVHIDLGGGTVLKFGELEVIDTLDFPEEGTRVRITEEHHTRRVGDDSEAEYVVPAGATAVVEGYVKEWCHVHVKLDNTEPDWVDVWIDPTVLETITEKENDA